MLSLLIGPQWSPGQLHAFASAAVAATEDVEEADVDGAASTAEGTGVFVDASLPPLLPLLLPLLLPPDPRFPLWFAKNAEEGLATGKGV